MKSDHRLDADKYVNFTPKKRDKFQDNHDYLGELIDSDNARRYQEWQSDNKRPY